MGNTFLLSNVINATRFSRIAERVSKDVRLGPIFVAVVLFILLTPGLLVQVPGRSRFIESGNFQTSGLSILVHAIIYFALICILLLAIGIHLYLG
ncbi:uncharacterized protein LOC120216158 [Hibiscus syriacus]|uniref:uncharacterized protein LOC120216158 n=1 Tax=Hibiscus syriacus TaxID=106335 RepID=UPI00192111EE|nr:uncharacterized protein LOC120216158 [Hibiscus syriacus]